jgi:hypothetical protein
MERAGSQGKGTQKLDKIFRKSMAAAETGGNKDDTIPVCHPCNVPTVVNPYSEEPKAARRSKKNLKRRCIKNENKKVMFIPVMMILAEVH